MDNHLQKTLSSNFLLAVGARRSPLSQVQVKEVFDELCLYHPEVKYTSIFLDALGDIDQITSLRELEKTDFFTREIDALVLSGTCRLAIHSAKDLPHPLPEGLEIAALTRGVDSSDALVIRENETIESLPFNALIATSSVRREEMVKRIRSDLQFVDIRGQIAQRLMKLINGEVDGVVIAEAAMIRLNLTHFNRIKLPGETTPLQGQLAIVIRENDHEMRALFSSIDSRQLLIE